MSGDREAAIRERGEKALWNLAELAKALVVERDALRAELAAAREREQALREVVSEYLDGYLALDGPAQRQAKVQRLADDLLALSATEGLDDPALDATGGQQ